MKLPFSFNLKLVFRLILPGLIISIGMGPIIEYLLNIFGNPISFDIAFITSVFIFGWVINIADMPIYMLFEGRRYWISFIRNLFLKFEIARLKRIQLRRSKAIKNDDLHTMLETSVELRKFPLAENGDICVRYPTRIGNLIASFEEYPNTRYGMDSIFYWPRIWLTLSKDSREEIDNQQALTDSALYTTFSLFISGFLSLTYSIIKILGITNGPNVPEREVLIITGSFCFVFGYILYRLSLHLFAQFGEIFKSVFDINYKNVIFDYPIEEVQRITGRNDLVNASLRKKYKVVWRYLHNYRVKRNEGEKSYTPEQFELEFRNHLEEK